MVFNVVNPFYQLAKLKEPYNSFQHLKLHLKSSDWYYDHGLTVRLIPLRNPMNFQFEKMFKDLKLSMLPYCVILRSLSRYTTLKTTY